MRETGNNGVSNFHNVVFLPRRVVARVSCSSILEERRSRQPAASSRSIPVLKQRHTYSADETTQTVKFELAYAFGYAERAPSNESPWNYVRGFFRAGGRSYADFPAVKERALVLQVSPAAMYASLKYSKPIHPYTRV